MKTNFLSFKATLIESNINRPHQRKKERIIPQDILDAIDNLPPGEVSISNWQSRDTNALITYAPQRRQGQLDLKPITLHCPFNKVSEKLKVLKTILDPVYPVMTKANDELAKQGFMVSG